ncbi:MAG: glycosyltransferase [Mycobacteriales bacterium]
MKVLLVHNRYSSAQPSGENTVVDAERALLAEAGVEVIDYERSSDEIGALSLPAKALVPLRATYSRQAVADVRRLIASARPDVLHLHNPYPLISPWVIRTARDLGVPVVQTVHNFRHVCANGIYFRDGHPCHDCLGKRVPWPNIVHGCYRDSHVQAVPMTLALTVHRSTWQKVDRYLALTPAIADHLRSAGIDDAHITVKPNSVPDPGEHDLTGTGFCYAGRLTDDKGVGVLLDAWLALPEDSLGTLTVAGDGPLRDRVAAVAAARSDVSYLGLLDRQGVTDLLRTSAVTVVPSRWDEVCPMIVLESLANARPVLGSDRGGLPYLVGDAGWTTPPTPEALREALTIASKEAPALPPTARHRYLTHFSPEVITHQLLTTYAELTHP